MTEEVPIQRGVRECCILSPFSFNLYSDKIGKSGSIIVKVEKFGSGFHVFFIYVTLDRLPQNYKSVGLKLTKLYDF